MKRARMTLEKTLRNKFQDGDTFTAMDVLHKHNCIYASKNNELTLNEVKSMLRGFLFIGELERVKGCKVYIMKGDAVV